MWGLPVTATTIAGSAAVTASLAQRTAATEALAVVNGQLAVAQVAATSTMAAWAASSTALGAAFAMAAKAGRTLLSLAAGWPGLIITVGLIAYSFLDFGDKAEEGTSKAANAFDDASIPRPFHQVRARPQPSPAAQHRLAMTLTSRR